MSEPLQLSTGDLILCANLLYQDAKRYEDVPAIAANRVHLGNLMVVEANRRKLEVLDKERCAHE